MNSFNVTAIGNLAKDPESTLKGSITCTRFVLMGNDFAGKDDNGNARETTTSVLFVAFDRLGEIIANNARIGDQLIVQAQLRSNTWIDKSGAKQFDNDFVVQSFRFGAPGRAKREEFAAQEAEAHPF
jgi:single-strand DNA-binding protein